VSKQDDKTQAAKDIAIKALAARDLTRRELIEFLVSKRHHTEVVDSAISSLEELGLVDDRRVAEAYVRTRMDQGPIAKVMVETELLERGIEPETVTTVLGTMMKGQDEENEALELARLRVRVSPARLDPDTIRRRVFAYLSRRGFDEETARQAVETAAAEYLGRP